MNALYSVSKTLFEFPPKRNGKNVIELRALTHGLPPRAVKLNFYSCRIDMAS